MMRLMQRVLILCVLAARGVMAQSNPGAADSTIGRALALGTANDSVAARAVLDSVMASPAANRAQRGEAAYWRSRYAASATDRERILAALIVDFPFSPRVPGALYEIATLELARNDRDRAATHFERFLGAAPVDSNRIEASLTLGRLLLERGDLARGCAVLLVGRTEVPEAAIEIRNQFEFSAGRCQGVDTTSRAPVIVPAVTAERSTTTRTAGAFTVQLAAYDQRAPADRLATTLRGQGLEARVVGTKKPFRVRVGRYATRADADEASHRIDAIAKSKSIVVIAGPEDK